MAHNTTKLGGAASDVVVGKVAVSRAIQSNGFLSQTFYSWRLARRTQHGLMMMTWKPTPVPDEEAFAAIKAGIDALPPGAKMFLNSGECGPLGHYHLDITPEHRKLTHAPSIFVLFCFRRVLRARREHSESRVGRALLREIPRIRRPRVPLR
jgi:hypothetical protein